MTPACQRPRCAAESDNAIATASLRNRRTLRSELETLRRVAVSVSAEEGGANTPSPIEGGRYRRPTRAASGEPCRNCRENVVEVQRSRYSSASKDRLRP